MAQVRTQKGQQCCVWQRTPDSNEDNQGSPKRKALMTSAYLCHYARYSLRKPQVHAYRRRHHHEHRYPDALHYATVNVRGVALTNVRLQLWQGVTARELALAPSANVMVGAVAEETYTSKSCDKGCCLVLQQPPPQGTYEMMPSTWIVTA